jgi:hypothetical protein
METLVFLLYQKGRDSRIFQAQDRAIDDFTAAVPATAHRRHHLEEGGGLALINCLDLQPLTRPRNGAGEHVRVPAVYGAFASRSTVLDGSAVFEAANALLAKSRPVRWLEDRREHLTSMNHARQADCEVESRSTVLGGSAVFEAANALLAKIRAAAGARLGCAAEQIELADGCARAADGRSLAFAQLAADGLRVTTAFGNDNRLTYTYGSAAAHVAVDPGTGDVELLDCLVVEDVGRIVNPLTLHGQAIGERQILGPGLRRNAARGAGQFHGRRGPACRASG